MDAFAPRPLREYLLFLSIARPEVSAVDVRAILTSGQLKSRHRYISSVLPFTGQHLVQVLEGRSADLDCLLKSIRSDTRQAARIFEDAKQAALQACFSPDSIAEGSELLIVKSRGPASLLD